MGRHDLVFSAGLSRFVVGGMAMLVLPRVYPATSTYVPVYAAYLFAAVIEQILIRRAIGGSYRTIIFGLIDGAVITFTLHVLGSCHTPMVAVYLFAGVLNALVIGPREGLALSAVSAVAYSIIVGLGVFRLVPYAPGVPELAALGPPSIATGAVAIGILMFLLLSSTAIVSLLMRRLGTRESDLMTANRSLEDLSRRDPLTGLYNRRYLFERIADEVVRARSGAHATLLLIDLDGFKRINDGQGHLRGDLLLEEIGTALRSATRATDVTARYGGDEFVVLLPDTDRELARAVAQRVAQAIAEVGAKFDAQRPVTASVGISAATADDGVAGLLRRADNAAYDAKRAGGNRVSEAS